MPRAKRTAVSKFTTAALMDATFIEYRLVAPLGVRCPYIGSSEGEVWAMVECAWGTSRQSLIDQGYCVLAFVSRIGSEP